MVARAEADGDARASAAHARVEALLRRHRPVLLRIARRWTGSPDEAEDALQRALEIYVRRLSTVDPATELAWMKVVVRHEAMAVARARPASASLDEGELGDRLPASEVGVDERIEREERKARSLEALAQLKPDERTALLLKAQGLSYREIGERKGWSYTKVNRAITEGRRRFLAIFARIESGEECERFAPTLLALARGDAAAADVVALRPHLRHCSRCRATVRELHTSMRHRLALRIPLVAALAPARWLGDRVATVDPAAEAVERGSGVRSALHGLAGRLTSPDVATGVQLGSSGGGRGPAVAALLSLCLGGGAGTYCVATGAFPDPVRLVHRSDERERDKPKRRAAQARASTRDTPAPAPTPLPAIPARPVGSAPATDARAASAPAPKPKRRPAPEDEFGFEGTTGTPGVAPPAEPPSATTATSSPPSSGGGSTPSSSPPPTSGGEFLP